ncbi:hypothetical protein FEM48_Zijuj02G0041000 [Ziziphus jujuba var. spinosa]|uniref:Uncharacterized protein n=1 Tax=Ziziphus jujuba var. spinosa TaxID=714518 RepID=A0A978VTI8_ZIZJJ|nr:hypothetical protein FEM48_Zijuj02G0041000 [Ziziphus jujuba var. spinosa]
MRRVLIHDAFNHSKTQWLSRNATKKPITSFDTSKTCAPMEDLREALRLHPVAPFNLPHLSISDCVVAGYFIPKGSSILLSWLGLGQNPKVWEDPLRFNPECHLKEGVANQQVSLAEPELRFITFTIGRRSYLGGWLGSTITSCCLLGFFKGLHGACHLSLPDCTVRWPNLSVSYCIVAGYFIPKDNHILLSRLELGRNLKVWKDSLSHYQKVKQLRQLVREDHDDDAVSTASSRVYME